MSKKRIVILTGTLILLLGLAFFGAGKGAVLAGATPDNSADVYDPAEVGSSVAAPLVKPYVPEAVLWDNGPLVTHPGGGTGGADVSALQTALGLTIFGFGHDVDAGIWVADDFDVADAAGWDVDSFTFFAYQTGSGTGSTMTAVNWLIYDGQPGAGGNVIFSGGNLNATGWTNIYRTLDTDLAATNRPIMANTSLANPVDGGGLHLDQGTYWLAWQTNGSLTSGPWAPPISILGQTTTGNGLQTLDNGATWNPALDVAAQQGFPFIVEGTVSGGGGGTLACNGEVVGFESGAFPGDWSITTLALPGGEWVVSTNNSSAFWDPGPAPEGVFYASANDDLPGSGSDGSEDYLYTNIIDLSGYSAASLNFWYHFDATFGHIAGGVEVSGDGGATWDGETIVPAGDVWQQYSLNMDAYAGNNNVQVRFHSDDGGAWAAGYGVDAVSLACEGGGEPPNIFVDPLSMSSTQPPDTQVVQGLDIENTGGEDLEWTIEEENTSVPTAAPTAGVSAAALTDHATANVSRPAVVTGPVVSGPTILIDQQPNGVNGYFSDSGCDLCAGAQSIADNFVLSGAASITEIVMWSGYFPTNVPVPDAITVKIHADGGGIPGAELYSEFPVTANRATTGVILFGVNEYVHTLTLAAPVNLGPGTYWVQLYNATGFGTDDWFWETGNLDPVNGIAGSVFAFETPGTGWNALADDMSMQIIAGGEVIPCDAWSDIPWLSLSSTGGVTVPGDTDTVDVTFDSTGLAPGTYTGNLCIYSNDPDPGPGNETDLVIVPVELVVEEGGGGGPLACNEPVVGFEQGVFPPGWFITTNALPGGEWVVSTNNSSAFWDPGPAPEGIYYASANDDLPGSGSDGSADYLYTNIIDLTGYSTASLNFWYHFDGTFGHIAGGVEVSGDGGATWDGETVVPIGDVWQQYSLNMDAYAGNSNVQVRFHSDDGGSWAAGYAVDAVSLECAGGGQEPDIFVDPLAIAGTQNTNTVTNWPLDIENVGTATLDWNIDEDNSLARPISDGVVPPANRVTFGDLSYSGSGLSGTTVTPQRETPAGLTTITHSATQNIVSGNSVSCNDGIGHTDNGYLRVFDLVSFGITGPFDVVEVEVGIEATFTAGGSQPATMNLYLWDDADPFTYANFTSIGSANTTVFDGDAGTVITVPVAGSAPAGSNLVVEFFTPNGQAAGNLLWVGSNPDGQTSPTYLAAADCGVPEPTDTAALGFPGMHLVMNVTGDTDAGPATCDAPDDIPWASVAPDAGSTAPGDTDTVTVTFDSTGLAAGTYNAALCVSSNDPDAGPGNGTELVVVDLELTVEQPTDVSLSGISGDTNQAMLPLMLSLLAVLAVGLGLIARRRSLVK